MFTSTIDEGLSDDLLNSASSMQRRTLNGRKLFLCAFGCLLLIATYFARVDIFEDLSVGRGLMEGTFKGPLDLNEKFEEINSPSPFYFDNMSQGVMRLAKYVQSPYIRDCMNKEEKQFWSSLVNPRRIRQTFGKYSFQFQLENASDVRIMEAVSSFYCIATHGRHVMSNGPMNARISNLFGVEVQVLTVGNPPIFVSAGKTFANRRDIGCNIYAKCKDKKMDNEKECPYECECADTRGQMCAVGR